MRRPCILPFKRSRPWKRSRRKPWFKPVAVSGIFLIPTVVAGALKGAIFAANVYERLGYGVVPNGSESRHDIIQAITFGSARV